MSKYLLSLCLLFIHIVPIVAQDTQPNYQSAENKWYWKNRKPHDGYWQQDVDYKIDAKLYDTELTIDGHEELIYTNNSSDTLKTIYFHLYQKAFQPESHLDNLNEANNFESRYGPREAKGLNINVSSVKSSTNTVNSVNFNNTIMIVELKKAIAPGEKASFEIDFKSYFDQGNVRRRMKVYAHNNFLHFDGVHWYPRIAVYDRRHGWETDQHLGKEFYGNYGTFTVNLSLPNNYIAEGTGILLNENEVLPADLKEKIDIKNFANKPPNTPPSIIIPRDNSFKIWKFRGINVHDFSFTCDPTYRRSEVVWNGIRCIALAQEESAPKWQTAAQITAKTIEIYSTDFGMYEWPKIVVADARDGMEYNMLTLCGGTEPDFHDVITHEVGHEWFYGMIGNNETYRAFMDEGFTQFLTIWAMKKIDGPYNNRAPYSNYDTRRYYKNQTTKEERLYQPYIFNSLSTNAQSINQHSDGFNGALGHGGGYGMVYYKAGTMLYNLEYVLGKEIFLKAMKNYVNQWKFCHPYPENFRESISHYTGENLDWFFDQWMETTKTIDYAIKSVKKDSIDGQYRIKLQRKGRMQMPVDLSIYTSDGGIKTVRIPNTYFKNQELTYTGLWTGWDKLNKNYTLIVKTDNLKITKVVLDSSRVLADVNLLNNEWPRTNKFKFDNQLKYAPDRTKYILYYRPDLWYNRIDGLKIGVHTEGNYFNTSQFFSGTVWYNSGLLASEKYDGYSQASVSYALSYATPLGTKRNGINIKLENRYLDGIFFNKAALTKDWDNGYTIDVNYKYFAQTSNKDYQYLLPQYTLTDLKSSSVNVNPSYNYTGNGNYGSFNMKLSLPVLSLLGENLSSPLVSLENKHFMYVGRIKVRNRIFIGIQGNQIFTKSTNGISIAGASLEEVLDNKFYRSNAYPNDAYNYNLPQQGLPLSYDNNALNLLHAAGGLNLRGYNNLNFYTNPTQLDNKFYSSTTNGISYNLENDLSDYIRYKPRVISNFIKVDIYTFVDAGLMNKRQILSPVEVKKYTYKLLVDAGIGTAFTIKQWGRISKAQPLTIRIDFPLYVSQPLLINNTKSFQFRWLAGFSRTF